MAAREEARKREEKEHLAAAMKRAEAERREREAALAEERRRAEEAKNAAAAELVEEKQRAEWLAKTEELKKLTEQMEQAKAALAAAEKQRLAAAKEATEASKAAEQAIATKRETERAQAKVAALPKLQVPTGPHPFDGTWRVHRVGPSCRHSDVNFAIRVTNGIVSGRNQAGVISGTVSASGRVSFSHPASKGGATMLYSGNMRDNSGSGTFAPNRSGRRGCGGTITLVVVLRTTPPSSGSGGAWRRGRRRPGRPSAPP